MSDGRLVWITQKQRDSIRNVGLDLLGVGGGQDCLDIANAFDTAPEPIRWTVPIATGVHPDGWFRPDQDNSAQREVKAS